MQNALNVFASIARSSPASGHVIAHGNEASSDPAPTAQIPPSTSPRISQTASPEVSPSSPPDVRFRQPFADTPVLVSSSTNEMLPNPHLHGTSAEDVVAHLSKAMNSSVETVQVALTAS